MLNRRVILSEILQSIQELFDVGTNVLVHRDNTILNTIQNSQAERYQDGICPASATAFGIDNLLFNARQIELTLPDSLSVLFVNKDFLQPPQHVKSGLHVKDLREILKRCKIISFTDWASFHGASDLWDRLRTDVIKPLGRKDFEFIFYIGRAEKKWAYEVDEILDIISDFSFSGKVTLVLTDSEAFELWKMQSGQKGDTKLSFVRDNDYKGQYIFNTMNIHQLLVYSPDHRVTIFSKEGSLELIGRGLHSTNVTYKARDYFNAGYIVGLLLQLSIIHCTALGLIVSGAYLRNEVIHDLKTLSAYIKDWINELDKTFVGD